MKNILKYQLLFVQQEAHLKFIKQSEHILIYIYF